MSKKNIAFAIVFAAAVLGLPPFLKNYGIYMFTTWLIYVNANAGLNLTVV